MPQTFYNDNEHPRIVVSKPLSPETELNLKDATTAYKQFQAEVEKLLAARILYYLVEQLGGDVKIPTEVMQGTGEYKNFTEECLIKENVSPKSIHFLTASGVKKRIQNLGKDW